MRASRQTPADYCARIIELTRCRVAVGLRLDQSNVIKLQGKRPRKLKILHSCSSNLMISVIIRDRESEKSAADSSIIEPCVSGKNNEVGSLGLIGDWVRVRS